MIPPIESSSADEVRLRRLVEHLPAAAVYVDGRRLFVNRAAETVTGYARDELDSIDAWMTKLHPGHADEVRELFARERLAGARRPVTVPITRPGGSERLVEITAYLEGDHEVWLLRDVTESARLARLMAQAEHGAAIGGWELDWRTMTMHWTEETYRLHGVRPESFAPSLKGLLGFYVPASAQQLGEAIRRAVSEGLSFDLELQLGAAGQQDRWVRAIGQAQREGQRTVRLFGSIQDVTERRRAAEALRESEERWSFALEAAATPSGTRIRRPGASSARRAGRTCWATRPTRSARTGRSGPRASTRTTGPRSSRPSGATTTASARRSPSSTACAAGTVATSGCSTAARCWRAPGTASHCAWWARSATSTSAGRRTPRCGC